MNRVSIFVDGANMYYAQKRLGWFIDYRKLLCYFRMTLGLQVADAFYYTAIDPNAKGRDATFHDYLLYSGYVLRTRHIKGCCNTCEEVPWEHIELAVDIVLDVLLTLDHFDVCAILSGDGNFERLVEVLRAKGKRVMILAHPEMTARKLRIAIGPQFYDLRDLERYVARTDRVPEHPCVPEKLPHPEEELDHE